MKKMYTDNLPQIAYAAEQVKQHEAQVANTCGIAMFDLMKQAGLAVYQVIGDVYPDASRILIFTGAGNNAGDGYIVADLALTDNYQVTVVALKDPECLTGDAKRAFELFSRHQHAPISWHAFINDSAADYDVVIDAMLGTGFSGPLKDPLNNACAWINQQHNIPVIAIDVPTGVNANSSQVCEQAVFADVTVSFIALKQGLLTGLAKEHVGQLLFAGLGIDDTFSITIPTVVTFKSFLCLKEALAKRSLSAYKNQLGHVLCIGGNLGMAGAIRLSAEAALRSGAGLVSVATHPENCALVQQGRYELMVHGVRSPNEITQLIAKASVIVIGPGLGQDEWSRALFKMVLNKASVPLIIDADGLNLLASLQSTSLPKGSVLTPHQGEMKRLLSATKNQYSEDRFDCVWILAKMYQAVAIYKGPGTLVCEQDRININQTGSAALASAGMGDVLSGIIAGLIAQKMNAFEATQLAVAIHGAAAQNIEHLGSRGLLASDLFPEIRRLIG